MPPLEPISSPLEMPNSSSRDTSEDSLDSPEEGSDPQNGGPYTYQRHEPEMTKKVKYSAEDGNTSLHQSTRKDSEGSEGSETQDFYAPLPKERRNRARSDSMSPSETGNYSTATTYNSGSSPENFSTSEHSPSLKPMDHEFEFNREEFSFLSDESHNANEHLRNYNFQDPCQKWNTDACNETDFQWEVSTIWNNSEECREEDLDEPNFRDIELNDELANILNQRHGKLVRGAQLITSIRTMFACKCFLHHSWETNIEHLRNHEWCPHCESLLAEVRKFASEKDGQCLNEYFLPELHFQCSKGHNWSSPCKSYRIRWCMVCKKQMKEEHKQAMKIEEERKQREFQKQQEELYTEAKRKMLQEQSAKYSFFEQSPNGQQFAQRVINGFKMVDFELDKVATKHAEE